MHNLVKEGRVNPFEQGRKLEKHIHDTLLPAYQTRYAKLMGGIEKHLLPLGFTLPQTDRSIVGGFFLWLSLPATLKADALARKCKEEGNVIIAPGSMFEVPGDDRVKFERSIRLCWAYEKVRNLAEGVQRIGEAAKKMLEGVENGESDQGDFVLLEGDKDGNAVAEFK
jgi:DNA-binding transcriptional MocR family regulator